MLCQMAERSDLYADQEVKTYTKLDLLPFGTGSNRSMCYKPLKQFGKRASYEGISP